MQPRMLSLLVAGSFLCAACQTTPATLTSTAPTAPTIEYDLQDKQGLIILRVTGVTLGEESTTVHIAITNGQREPIQIDLENDVTLYDKVNSSYHNNNQYLLSLPADISKIQIEPGTTMKGQFVFMGRLSPEEKLIRLITKITYQQYNEYQKKYVQRTKEFDMNDIEIKRGHPDEQNN